MNRKMVFCALLAITPVFAAFAGDDPREVRHEMMEGVRDGAKALGAMLKGEAEFDAAAVEQSLATFKHASENFGDLFPEGTETGYNTEARDTIWSDRDGFNAELAKFGEAVDAAIAANPQDLESLKPAAGPVFKACKSCQLGKDL